MDEKITIIEGPPPTFESNGEAWALGLNESPKFSHIAITRLRTYNGPALLERCNQAWRKQANIHLEYRDMDGFKNMIPILAARTLEMEEGQVLLLWVRLEKPDSENNGNDNNDDNFETFE